MGRRDVYAAAHKRAFAGRRRAWRLATRVSKVKGAVMIFARRLVATACAAIFASAANPAMAQAAGGTPVDEPAALALLALGVTGLIVGRQVARRRD